MKLCFFVLPLLFLLTSCAKQKAPQQVEGSKEPAASATALPNPSPATVPVPNEEPSEEVLRKLEFQIYDQIEEMGGMPVTITATGHSMTLHPKLYEVRKEKCSPTPQAPQGWYECDLMIKLSLSPDGSDPSEKGERIGVKWSPKGEWVLQ